MTPHTILLSLCVLGLALIRSEARAFDWQTASPESQGMSSAKLDTMTEGLRAHRTKMLLVVRHDRIVHEWYAKGHSRATRHYTASMAKALVGGMSLLVAVDDERIAPDDLACKYVPSWGDDPRKSRITIRHLATHASGIEDAEEDGKPHNKLTGWKGAFWKKKPNPFLNSRDDAPVIFEPGADIQYSNPGMGMLSYCVSAALRGAPESDVRSLLTKRIMDPIGVPRSEWSMGYGATYELDGLKLHANWGGGSYSPNAVARVGRLMLRKGDWDRERLVSEEAVELVTSDAGMPTPDRSERLALRSGFCWWLNSDGILAGVPRDMFAGAGAGNQVLVVIPSLDLIVVRNGSQLHPKGFWEGIEEYLLNPLMEAITEPPYLPSRVIRSAEFAPESSIVRAAVGSDNWPITWGDDDAQFCAYGDGWGFDPRIEKKLSLGFAMVTGTPGQFKGVNVRSENGERTGDGPKGPKASGMLMVDGVLYMLVRNVGNSQLAWSRDRGRTWQWGFRFDTSFGCPSFLNFGRNYEGARDEYVYLYSPDGPSAYESADAVVLARVPKGKMTTLAAYEFFVRTDDAGAPVWSSDLSQRGPVFVYPGHCGRLDVAYDAAIRRYLMALGFDHHGGWGIFDAPEPWGPWTTVFFTKDWGLGDTHSYRLPTRWISPDGLTLHLVFSGRRHEGVDYDAFCVRELRLRLYPD